MVPLSQGLTAQLPGNRQGKRIVPAGRKDMAKSIWRRAVTELRPFRPVAFALHGRRNAAYDVSSLCLYLQPDWMCLSYHNSHVPTGGLAVGQGLNLERGPKAMKQYTADKIRNLALAGHGNAGKTSLAEAMLYLSGATDRLGKTAEGNTVCDFDPEEIKRKVSVSSAIAPLEWKGSKINLLDTPGLFDFAAGMYEGARAADCLMIAVSAKSGVSVGTEKAYSWRERSERAGCSSSPSWIQRTPTMIRPWTVCGPPLDPLSARWFCR